jgi:rhodanese-related sulfurtransferase
MLARRRETLVSVSARLSDVGPEQAVALLAGGDAVLLDVREPDEWAAGHAPQARHLPLGQVAADALTAGRTVIAVCRSGNRSGKAADLLGAAGVPVRNLRGGMKAWRDAGLPVVTDDGRPGSVA